MFEPPSENHGLGSMLEVGVGVDLTCYCGKEVLIVRTPSGGGRGVPQSDLSGES